MTGPRSDRSAALFVGWTPSTATNVQSAGQILRRLLAKPRWYLFFGVLRPACSTSVAELGLGRRDVALEAGAVLVVLEVVPGVEHAACELEPLLAEGLLGGEPFCVEAKISLEMTPTRLAAFGVDVVVGPPAVGAADAGEPVAEQLGESVAVAVSGDPEDRRRGDGGRPEGAGRPGGRPAGLVDVDRGRPENRGDKRLVWLCQRG